MTLIPLASFDGLWASARKGRLSFLDLETDNPTYRTLQALAQAAHMALRFVTSKSLRTRATARHGTSAAAR